MSSKSFIVPSRSSSSKKVRNNNKARSYSEVNVLGNSSTAIPDVKRKRSNLDDAESALYNRDISTQNKEEPMTSSPRKKYKKPGHEEKRLRRFRAHPPASYIERLDRVRTQRMFLIDRTRQTSADKTHEEETFDLAGITGNVYRVTISKIPSCTCPDAAKGNQCKHIVYVCITRPRARGRYVNKTNRF
jgi:hypothetical protein